MNSIKKFINDESGVTAIEYAMIAALIGVAAVAVLKTVGTNVTGVFQKIADNVKA